MVQVVKAVVSNRKIWGLSIINLKSKKCICISVAAQNLEFALNLVLLKLL